MLALSNGVIDSSLLRYLGQQIRPRHFSRIFVISVLGTLFFKYIILYSLGQITNR